MNITWNEDEYENNFSFVHRYGEDVLKLIDAPQGATVLDLGCGNGVLVEELAEAGYHAVGLDDSADMIASARATYPEREFIHANAIDFTLDKPVDAVFSNAVLHWIDKEDQPALLASVFRALKPGGQFVFECGGFGNAHLVHSALVRSFAARGLAYRIPQYFPTIGEYATMLESVGFKVVFAMLFDRFTPLIGDSGLADWIRMFQQAPFEGMNGTEKETIIQEVVEATRSELYVDGIWHVDYVRLRMKVLKPIDLMTDKNKKSYILKPVLKPLNTVKSEKPSKPIFRDITEDDDGYHPYADVPDMRPLFEEDSWD